jgi:hypothetical protein
MDASPERGGLDLVLGLEADSGLRWSHVEAPMGYLDSSSFVRELVHWEGIDVLGADPWSGASLQGWEVRATYSAMCSAEEWLVVDEGDIPISLETYGVKNSAATVKVTLVELSLYGLSQALGKMMRQKAHAGEDATAGNSAQSWDGSREGKTAQEVFIGVPSARACGKRRALVSVEQAAAYLGVDFLGTLSPLPKIERDISRGLGIVAIPKQYERLISSVLSRAGAGDVLR